MLKKTNAIVLIMIISTLSLVVTGCSSTNTNDEPEPNGLLPGTIAVKNDNVNDSGIPSSTRGSEEWRYVNELLGMLGKTALEIVTENDTQIQYIWFDEQTELLALHNGGSDIKCMLFSGPIWEDDSRCTGIFFTEDYSVKIPDSAEQLREIFGEGAQWFSAGGSENAYYRYLFDDNVEIRFYTDTQGAQLNKNMLIKTADAKKLIGGIDFPYPDKTYLRAELRKGEKFKKINQYAAYIGKTLEEVKKDYPSMEFLPDMGYYKDENTGIYFSIENDSCYDMILPFELIFPDYKTEKITREEINNYWNICHSWILEEGCFYAYLFDDVSIGIGSYVNGEINTTGYNINIQAVFV